MPADIDQLQPLRSLIDLQSHQQGDFGIDDYKLSFIFDDIILVVPKDLDESGDNIMRNGIVIPTNAVRSAWRKGEVILVGPNVKYCKLGDVVVYPSDRGLPVAGIEVEGYGKLKKGLFLNEERLFGICKPLTTNDEIGTGQQAVN
ncbi:hypothetical protein EBU95_20735 [bacterium]|nr:hypothetical protein [bacterium]